MEVSKSRRIFLRFGQLEESKKFAILATSLVAACFSFIIFGCTRLIVHPTAFIAPDATSIDASIQLRADIVDVDPISKTITLDWRPLILCQPGFKTILADIYMASGTLDSSSPTFSNSLSPPLLYFLNSTLACQQTQVLATIFRTVTRLNSAVTVPDASHATLQSYPFDVYFAEFLLYSVDHETGASYSLNISQSTGIAVNFQVSAVRSFVKSKGGLYLLLRVERSTATKIFVITVAISNWLVAVGFLLVIAASCVYTSTEIYTEIFVVPFGALYAFTTIRANFPGAPLGFGATIDLFTILPVLVILSLSSFILLLSIMFRRIKSSQNKGPQCNACSSSPQPSISSPRPDNSLLSESTEIQSVPLGDKRSLLDARRMTWLTI